MNLFPGRSLSDSGGYPIYIINFSILSGFYLGNEQYGTPGFAYVLVEIQVMHGDYIYHLCTLIAFSL
jgi:hypothetical protein